MKKSLVLLGIICCVCIVAKAQDSTLSKKQLRLARKAEKVRSGKLMVTPLGGPFYTPELQFAIAGGVLTSWRMDKKDTTLQRSSTPITLGVSTNGALFVSAKPTVFFKGDKLRLYSDLWYKNMPDNYFGIGYVSDANTPKSDTTTKYKRTWFQVNPRLLWQFKKDFFVGGALDVNYTKGRDACSVVAADAVYKEYNDKPFNMGLGVLVQMDTRDVAVNAWKGWFLEAQAMAYGKYLGGDNNYDMFSFDARHYIPIKKPAHTLALQLRGRFTVGDVPYAEMSQLGTPFDLRGYLWGQYRDKSMLFGIAEYRHQFYKRDGKRSKHGFVGWVGTGSVAPNAHFEYWLPNGGIGYRIEVQPRMNLRLDFGLGNGTKGFYFNFNEAF